MEQSRSSSSLCFDLVWGANRLYSQDEQSEVSGEYATTTCLPEIGRKMSPLPPTQKQEVVFGRVESVGPVPESDLWGARILAQPDLMPAFVSPFPLQLLPVHGKGTSEAEDATEGRLSQAIGTDRWRMLQQRAREASCGVCEVTGARPQSDPLKLIPVWQFNDVEQIVKVCFCVKRGDSPDSGCGILSTHCRGS